MLFAIISGFNRNVESCEKFSPRYSLRVLAPQKRELDLQSNGQLSFGKTFWTAALQCWLLLSFVGSLALLSYFTFGRFAPGRVLFGRPHCPECDRDYDPAIFFGLNFGRTRYERCPHCRHWHWTKAQPTEGTTEQPRE